MRTVHIGDIAKGSDETAAVLSEVGIGDRAAIEVRKCHLGREADSIEKLMQLYI